MLRERERERETETDRQTFDKVPSESTEHYVFECHLYTNQRNNLMHNLHARLHINDVNVAILTAG